MRGRPPKPTALKLVAGNPGKRSMNKQEPDPTYLQDLTPPAWLRDDAKAVWSEIAPIMSAAKLLTEVDVQAFAMGCVAVAQYRLATDRIGDAAVKHRIVEDGEGNPVEAGDRKSTRLNSSHHSISYAVFCLKKKKGTKIEVDRSWILCVFVGVRCGRDPR